MQVCSSAAATAEGTPEALTIARQILPSTWRTRLALPEAAIVQS